MSEWIHAPDVPKDWEGRTAWKWVGGLPDSDMRCATFEQIPRDFSRDPQHCGDVYFWPCDPPSPPKHIRDMTAREIGEHLFPHRKGTAASDFPSSCCTAWEDCRHDGVCHDPQGCGAVGPMQREQEE